MRDGKEIAEIVDEVERGWQALRDKARKTQAQIYRHKSYDDELIAELDPSITERVPYSSTRPALAAWQLQGILRTSLSFHVEPKPGKGEQSPDSKRADKEELFYAHLWAEQLNRGGVVSDATHRHQAASPFAAWWLDWNGFALPKAEDDEEEDDYKARKEAYRRGYSSPRFPITLSVLPPLTVAFLPDDIGKPTTSVRHFDLPYVEIARRYGKGGKTANDAGVLRILRDQFPYLRGGKAQSIQSVHDAWTSKARVRVVDDCKTISYCIDLDGRQESGADRYQPIEDQEFANPWGGNSLTIVTGQYNDDAELLEDRYRSLNDPLLGAQRKMDVLVSHMSSIALTPSKWGEQLEEELARMVQQEGRSVPIEFGDGGIATLYGKMAEMRTNLDPKVGDILVQAIQERDAALPPPFLTNPDEALVRNATASAQLHAHETSNRSYDAPRASYIAGILDVCSKVRHFICEGHLNKKGQGAEANEAIYLTVTGTEPTKKYRGDQKGTDLTMGPDDFDEHDTLEISIVPSSQSAKQLDYELTRQQVTDGVKTREQLIETFTEDVTGQKKKLETEARFQEYAPLIRKADLLATIELIRLESGMDMSMLLMPEVEAGGGAGGSEMPPSDGMSGTRMDAPATTPPDVAVMG